MNWIGWLSILWAILKSLFGKDDKLDFDWGENDEKLIEEELNYPVIEEEKEEFGKFLWVLDNGHGKLTRGKRSPFINDRGDRLYEYEFNRDIVERIIARIEPMGFHYYDLVDDYIEKGNFLKGRVDRANNILSPLPKVYVSIHANAGPSERDKWSLANGVETWYKKGSMLGAELAEIFQKHIVAQTGWRDRGIKFKKIKREEFYVIKRTKMVAILTENGFYNNRRECDLLMREEIRQAIADAHVEAMMEIERIQLINEDEVS